MRRRAIASDYFDQAFRWIGIGDVTGAAGKLPAIALRAGVAQGVGGAGVVPALLASIDKLLLWSPTAQEVKVYTMVTDAAVAAGAANGSYRLADVSIGGGLTLSLAYVTPVVNTDSTNFAFSSQIGSVILPANTDTPYDLLPAYLQPGSSLLLIGQVVAVRLVANWAWRWRYTKNPVLQQSGG